MSYEDDYNTARKQFQQNFVKYVKIPSDIFILSMVTKMTPPGRRVPGEAVS